MTKPLKKESRATKIEKTVRDFVVNLDCLTVNFVKLKDHLTSNGIKNVTTTELILVLVNLAVKDPNLLTVVPDKPNTFFFARK